MHQMHQTGARAPVSLQRAPAPTPRAQPGPDRLRILHVSEIDCGGVVSLLDHFVTQQIAEGHDVHVLAPPAMPSWPGCEQHTWAVERGRPQTVMRAVRQLRRTVQQVGPDVVHLHSFVAGFLGRLPMALGHRHRMPVVYQPHAWSTGLHASPVFARAVGAAEHRAAARTDLLVTNCRDEIDAGARLGVVLPARKLGVAVDLDRFQPVPESERRAWRARLGIEAERLVLVLGRMVRQKGQDLLVPAWERRRPDATLLALVGPGDASVLSSKAPTQWGTTIRAFGESRDVRPWLKAADLLLLPSRYETVGVAVAEALATGLPVVATAVDGVSDVLLGGDLPAAGCVVPPGDMDGLIAAAERRLNDHDLRRRESIAARVRAERLFRPEAVARRLEAAYREAIALRTDGVHR